MIKNKKYFWLKLKDDFFQNKEIKLIRKYPSGSDILIVFFKMQLLSLKNMGLIEIDGILPTVEEELSLLIDEDLNLVKISLPILAKLNIISIINEKDIQMLYHEDMTGIHSETASTIRSRKCRESKKLGLNQPSVALQQNCNTEIEIDIEKDKEIELDKEPHIENHGVLKSYLKYISEKFNIPISIVEKDCKKHNLHKEYNEMLLESVVEQIEKTESLKNKDIKYYAMFLKYDELEKISCGFYQDKSKKESSALDEWMDEEV